MRGQLLEGVALSSTALGLLGRFVEGPSPFAAAVPDESPLAEREAVAGLVARGLLVVIDDGLSLGEGLAEFVAVANAADEVLIAEVTAGDVTQKVAWLRGTETTLEQLWQPPAGFRLLTTPASEVEARVQTLLSLPRDEAAGPAAEVTIEAETLARATQIALAGDADELPPELPGLAAAFVEALAAGARRCSLDRRASAADGRVHGCRIDWIDAGWAGLWSLDRGGDHVTVRRLKLRDLQASVLELIAAAQPVGER